MPAVAGKDRERYSPAILFSGYWHTSGEEMKGCPKVQLLMTQLPEQICVMYCDNEDQPLLRTWGTMYLRFWDIMEYDVVKTASDSGKEHRNNLHLENNTAPVSEGFKAATLRIVHEKKTDEHGPPLASREKDEHLTR